jgi:hypothetical protein
MIIVDVGFLIGEEDRFVSGNASTASITITAKAIRRYEVAEVSCS